jgi:hypothetical protein
MGSKKKKKKKDKVRPKAIRREKAMPKAKAPVKRDAAKAKAPARSNAAHAPRAPQPTSAPSGGGPAAKPAGAPRPPARKGGRRSSLALRRGPDGQPLQPGEILLPGGPSNPDEIQYLLRGCAAAEHPNPASGVDEIAAKKAGADLERGDLFRYAEGMADRFERGSIEALLPTRPPGRRNFQGVVERAKHRRREIGAFLRGLDLGRTETSHMDSHGEASLQSLMEWAARLENLVEADEPDQADYAQFHRGLDQLENTTEALIVDVEQTLRRLRDRIRAQ